MRNLCVVFLALLLLTMSCKSPTTIETYDIRYRFESTAEEVFITYLDSQGEYRQVKNVSGTWMKVLTLYSGDTVYLSAQNLTPSGVVRVAIFVNDDYYKATWSQGAYCIAMVQGILE